MQKQKQKMYVVAVDMGYGHQRAAYPFLANSENGIINANHYPGISRWEENSWKRGRFWYEIISRFKNVPLIGKTAFHMMDEMQRIEPFYPRRDLRANSQQQKYFYNLVKKGLGKQLINALNRRPLPFLTTFFVPAYFAEYHGYKGPIYCVVCDADVARAWAPVNGQNSRITYLVPNRRVKSRLQLYGVKEQNILVTGFPLPKENIGGRQQHILRSDLRARLYNLDPRGLYRKKYAKLIEGYLCPVSEIKKNKHPLTLTFAVGGAGAQREIGVTIVEKLRESIKRGHVRLNLVAGSRNDVYTYFQKSLQYLKLSRSDFVNIIYAEDKYKYFELFNHALRTTDVLWTKPSELIFYSGLGLPIVMTEPIGYQEKYNREWLLANNSGVDVADPRYVNEWLFDWLDSGWLAETAMNGYLDAAKLGAYHIENVILNNKPEEIEDIHYL